MVHLNMNYSESFLHLPTAATNEERKQDDSDKVIMFDIRKETNYLNNLQLKKKVKEVVLEDRHQRIETNLKNPELVHKVQDEEMIPYNCSNMYPLHPPAGGVHVVRFFHKILIHVPPTTKLYLFFL